MAPVPQRLPNGQIVMIDSSQIPMPQQSATSMPGTPGSPFTPGGIMPMPGVSMPSFDPTGGIAQIPEIGAPIPGSNEPPSGNMFSNLGGNLSQFDMSSIGGSAPSAGGGKQSATANLGKTAGAAIGTAIMPGVGTAIGAGVGEMVGSAAGASKKSAAQRSAEREQLWKEMQTKIKTEEMIYNRFKRGAGAGAEIILAPFIGRV